LLILIN